MQKKPWLGIVVVALLLGGLMLLNNKPVECEGVRRLEVKPLSAGVYELSWEMGFHNPNLLSCTFETINMKILINGSEQGEVVQTIAQGIPGRKSTYFPVNIRLTREQYEQLKIDNATEFNFSGKALFSSFGSKKEVNINKTETITTANSI